MHLNYLKYLNTEEYKEKLYVDFENNFFEFYPINSLSVETCNMKDMSWKDSLGEKDIYWYDIRKRKVQIIEMLDLNEKLRFQRKLNDVFAQFINSLEQ